MPRSQVAMEVEPLTGDETTAWINVLADAFDALVQAGLKADEPTWPHAARRPAPPKPRIVARVGRVKVMYPCPLSEPLGHQPLRCVALIPLPPKREGEPEGKPDHYTLLVAGTLAKELAKAAIRKAGARPRDVLRLLEGVRARTRGFEQLRARREQAALRLLAREHEARRQLQAEAALRALAQS